MLEENIQHMKEQLMTLGEVWKNTRDKEILRDCLALFYAINALEERVYGKIITTVRYILD